MKFRIDIKSSVEYTQLDCVVAEAELASCSKISDTNLTKFTANFRKEIPALGYLKLNNVYVLGNGLLLDENKKRIRSPFLPYSLLNNESGLRLSSGPIQKETDGKFSTRELSVITIDEPVALLTQPGDRIFGHWLVDILPRLSLLRNIDSPLKYILKNDVLNGSAISDIKEIFKLAEFDTSHAFGLKPVANAYFCKSLIVPSVVRYGQQIHSYVGTLYEPYIKLNHSKCDSPTKVYLSRRKWKGENSRRILENALELENHFIKKGYNVIFPEELSFIEKIDLFCNVICVIGEKGSALHLSLFSTSVKKMIIILNPNESENGLPLLQSEICALKNVDCSFIVGNELAERKGYTVSIDSVVDIN